MEKPSFAREQTYWDEGYARIAGLDEAGLGALAGPVIAAAVIFAPQSLLAEEAEKHRIRDSKLLTPHQRTTSAVWIKAHALAWAVGSSSVEEIDTHNVRRASHLAMSRALKSLAVGADLLLVDGNPLVLNGGEVRTINVINGDASSYSIAAASILAKVARDELLEELHTHYPQYGFAQHKGYGSKTHLTALRAHGPCRAHRRTYAPIARLLTAPHVSA